MKTIVIACAILFGLVLPVSAKHPLTSSQFIARWEGHRNQAYYDSGGQPTICYGNAYYTAFKRVRIGDYRNDAQCFTLLANTLARTERDIARYYPGFYSNLNNNQRVALTSLVYNIGIGNFAKSRVLRYLRAGYDKHTVAKAFYGWNRDQRGVVLKGLSRRRHAEAILFAN